MPAAFAVPSVAGTVASTIGTAPRRPAQERKAWSRSGIRNGVSETQHGQRPGDEQQDQPDEDGRAELRGQLRRRGEQPEQDEQPDLGDRAERGREAVHGRPVRKPEVPEHEGGRGRRR